MNIPSYVLMFALVKNPAFKALGQNFLNLAKIVVKQDADILRKISPNTRQKIKLNNEVGMDWARPNFKSWPEIAEPNFSK